MRTYFSYNCHFLLKLELREGKKTIIKKTKQQNK